MTVPSDDRPESTARVVRVLPEGSIDKRFDKIPDDSAAAVFTSGLLGDQYVALQPGGSPDVFKNGDEVILTQSSMQLEELIGKYLVGSGDKPGAGKADDAAKPAAKP